MGKQLLIALKLTRSRRPTFDTLSLLPPADKVQSRRAAPIDFCDHEWPQTHESVIQDVLLAKKTFFYSFVIRTDSLFDLRRQVNTMIMNWTHVLSDELRSPRSSGNYTQRVKHTKWEFIQEARYCGATDSGISEVSSCIIHRRGVKLI